MTGFGRGVATAGSKKITVEIKSLNSKQLDLFMRSPSQFRQLEVSVRGMIAAELERGKVEFSATVENTGASTEVRFNGEAMANYKREIEEASAVAGLGQPDDWFGILLRLPDVMVSTDNESDADGEKAYAEAAREAAEALTAFRTAEGRKLYGFFAEKIANIGALLDRVEPFEKSRVEKIRARLEEQLASLHGVDYDKGRLEQELIFYIEKLDVTEEKLRLRSHLSYFMETMGAEDGKRPAAGQGKKLGFIAQEMGREINTLGSKSNNADMQKIVVMMKDELEQIKEQVLNVL